MRTLIAWAGDDPKREGLLDTPKRVVNAYNEFFKGYEECPIDVLSRTFDEVGGYDDIVMLRDIDLSSHCEHHMVPFFGDYVFAYIPDKKIIGASKIARVVDFYSAKLQIAERLCKDVVDKIEKTIEPKGIILLMSGRHLCKEMRGVKKYNSPFEAIEARGCFLENTSGCKDEFVMRACSGVIKHF